MNRIRRRSSKGPLWLFALALLLRAAMPFLADASAELQGRALSEVCSVHGVSIAPPQSHEAPAGAADHGADHCALNALAALGEVEATTAAIAPAPAVGRPRIASFAPAHPPDDTTAWVARRKQGPPPLV